MDNIAIVASSKDPAGVNIRNNLLELYNFKKINENFDNNEIYEFSEFENIKVKLYLVSSDLVYSENIDKRINADFMVFASKHRSKENTPSFTVHSIGNWGAANLGGKEKELCPCSAVLMKNMFIELNNAAKDSGYEITMEATHHGPFVITPSIFAEIGSTEKEWNEKRNGEIIAKAIMDGIKNENKNYRIASGLGGTHYCANFNKIIMKTDISFSFVCPKYSLSDLNEDLLSQILQKTKEKVDFILLDWKGLGQEKQRILDLIKKLGINYIRADKI